MVKRICSYSIKVCFCDSCLRIFFTNLVINDMQVNNTELIAPFTGSLIICIYKKI